MAEVITAQSIAKRLRTALKKKRKTLGKIALASLQVGKDEATEVYISAQKRVARQLDIEYKFYGFPKNASPQSVGKLIDELNKDNQVKGIIIHRPLPSAYDLSLLASGLLPPKDIEGITPYNLGRILLNKPVFVPPTVLSVLKVLEATGVELYGKDVVIVGFTAHIGKPLTILLGDRLSTVCITHIATYQKKRLPFYIRNADILISSVGKPHLIKGEWLKKGAVVIDVGIAKYKGKITGDVDFESAVKRASFITPVPGGVGALTTVFLFKNLIEAASR